MGTEGTGPAERQDFDEEGILRLHWRGRRILAPSPKGRGFGDQGLWRISDWWRVVDLRETRDRG